MLKNLASGKSVQRCRRSSRTSAGKVVELGEKRRLHLLLPPGQAEKSLWREAQKTAGPFFRGATEALPFGRLKKGPAVFCASRQRDFPA